MFTFILKYLASFLYRYFLFKADNKGIYEYEISDRNYRGKIISKYIISKDIPVMRIYNDRDTSMSSRKVILYSHGSGSKLATKQFLLTRLCNKLDTDIFGYEYIGYNYTNVMYSEPSEKNCYQSIYVAYGHLLEIGYRPENVYLLGVSMGTGPTLKLASLMKTDIAGVILLCPFTSIIDIMDNYFLNLLKSYIDIFENYKYIKQVEAPILILHGDNDKVIHHQHSLRLESLIPCECEIIDDGQHYDLLKNEEVIDYIREFIG